MVNISMCSEFRQDIMFKILTKWLGLEDVAQPLEEITDPRLRAKIEIMADWQTLAVELQRSIVLRCHGLQLHLSLDV